MNKIRTCIVTNKKLVKNKLIRIVKTKDNNFLIDENQKILGRGSYILNDKIVISELISKRALNRAFKTNVPKGVYDKLVNLINKG